MSDAERRAAPLRGSAPQVRVTGAGGAEASGPHWPVTFDVTFGGLPAPCEMTCVERVQVAPPLLTDTTVVLVSPAGKLP